MAKNSADHKRVEEKQEKKRRQGDNMTWVWMRVWIRVREVDDCE
jgi:hypothetical protein